MSSCGPLEAARQDSPWCFEDKCRQGSISGAALVDSALSGLLEKDSETFLYE